MSKESTNMCKGFAVLMMFVHHLFYSAKTYENFQIIFFPISEDRLLWIARGCKICVSIFVLLTGYGYTMSEKKQKVNKNCYKKYSERYFRIMFGYWFIFIIAQLTFFLGRDPIKVYGEVINERIRYMIIDFFGVAKLFGTPTFNPTWWYITYAILLVFLTPLLIKVVKRIGMPILIITIFLPRVLELPADTTFMRYVFALVIGIYLAEYDILHISDKRSPFPASAV